MSRVSIQKRMVNLTADRNTFREFYQKFRNEHSQVKAIRLTRAKFDERGPSGFPLHMKADRKNPISATTASQWLRGISNGHGDRFAPDLLTPSEPAPMPVDTALPDEALLERIESLLNQILTNQSKEN